MLYESSIVTAVSGQIKLRILLVRNGREERLPEMANRLRKESEMPERISEILMG